MGMFGRMDGATLRDWKMERNPMIWAMVKGSAELLRKMWRVGKRLKTLCVQLASLWPPLLLNEWKDLRARGERVWAVTVSLGRGAAGLPGSQVKYPPESLMLGHAVKEISLHFTGRLWVSRSRKAW